MLDKIKAVYAAIKAPWDKVVSYVAAYPQVALTGFVAALVVALRYF